MTHIYVFYWNDCIWESAPRAVSMHRTAKGAYTAMRKHIFKSYDEFIKTRDGSSRHFRKFLYNKFGESQYWYICKIEIQE